eukprot:Skav227054  [mRNA]  locus=scaffold72:821508:825541:- [translate_table: standard]
MISGMDSGGDWSDFVVSRLAVPVAFGQSRVEASIRFAYENTDAEPCVKAKVLDWVDLEFTETAFRPGQADVVIMSDVVYFPHLQRPLLHTLLFLCNESTLVFWANCDRYPEFEPNLEHFMEVLEPFFSMTVEEERSQKGSGSPCVVPEGTITLRSLRLLNSELAGNELARAKAEAGASNLVTERHLASKLRPVQVMPMPDIAVNPRLWSKSQNQLKVSIPRCNAVRCSHKFFDFNSPEASDLTLKLCKTSPGEQEGSFFLFVQGTWIRTPQFRLWRHRRSKTVALPLAVLAEMLLGIWCSTRFAFEPEWLANQSLPQ